MSDNIRTSEVQYVKMTQTPVHKLIISLSIPTIITMVITNIYNLADTIFVGQLGNSASGAIGIVFGFMAVLQAVGFMVGQGSGSILSRMLGHKDKLNAARIASTGIILSFSIAVIISSLGLLFLEKLIFALGSTETIAPFAKQYLIFILISGPFIVTSFVMNNILRYEGKAFLGMIGMLSGAILNIALDPILMFVCKLGVIGAGLSTAISQICGFFILLYMFLSGKTECEISIKKFIFDIKTIGEIFATGLPSLLRQGLTAVATMILNNESAVYSDEAVAAMSIVSRIIMFVFSVSVGVGQGFQPVSAFNFGASRFDRVKSAFWFTVVLSEIFLLVVDIFVNVFPKELLQLFRDDETVIMIAERALRFQSFALLFLPICMVTEMMLQTTGEKFGAALLSSLRSGLLFIPVLIFMAKFRGLAGIQEAQPIAHLLSVPVSVWYLVYFFRKMESNNL